MAQKRELVCDRCGKEILNLDRCGLQMLKEFSAKIHYWPVGTPRSYGEQRIDLCEACAEDFATFMQNEEKGD